MISEDPAPQPPAIAATVEPVLARVCRTAITILVWYGISDTIILATKELFTKLFPFPLVVTTYSNFIAFLWAALFSCHPKYRAPWPTKQQLWSYIIPIGFCTGVEIGSSNLALKILTVSFGTILKGSSPFFTFCFGLLFGIEQFNLKTMGCLLLIGGGIALASLGEGNIRQELGGFCLQLFATALGGFRWAMTHKMLKGTTTTLSTNDGNNDNPQTHLHQQQHMSPLTATLYTAPTTALCVLPIALGVEVPTLFAQDDSSTKLSHHQALLTVTIMTVIATLVFLLLMSEYWLVKATSSLALSVAGVFKELLLIGGGMFFFSEHVDFLNVVGFFTCQVGILSYVFVRYDGTTTTETEDASYAVVVTGDDSANGVMEVFEDELELTGSDNPDDDGQVALKHDGLHLD